MTEVIPVYRFENDEGKGPWTCWPQGSGVYDDYREEGPSCWNMPVLTEEGDTPVKRHYTTNSMQGWVFGFTSLEQLKRAFPCAVGREAMGKVGVHLKKYLVRVERVLSSPSQCIFPKEEKQKSLAAILDIVTLEEK